MHIKYITETTQAYRAGVVTALLYNNYPARKDLPPLTLCMRDFSHLPTVMGKYYTLLKINKNTNSHIAIYEKYSSLMEIPQQIRGSYGDFMQGYSKYIKKEKISPSDARLKLLGL